MFNSILLVGTEKSEYKQMELYYLEVPEQTYKNWQLNVDLLALNCYFIAQDSPIKSNF